MLIALPVKCFSCGAFKKAYHAFDSIVVKFCSTNKERASSSCSRRYSGAIRAYFLPYSTRYTYNYHYHTWCKNPGIDDFELSNP